jgi:hypothetical protein
MCVCVYVCCFRVHHLDTLVWVERVQSLTNEMKELRTTVADLRSQSSSLHTNGHASQQAHSPANSQDPLITATVLEGSLAWMDQQLRKEFRTQLERALPAASLAPSPPVLSSVQVEQSLERRFTELQRHLEAQHQASLRAMEVRMQLDVQELSRRVFEGRSLHS